MPDGQAVLLRLSGLRLGSSESAGARTTDLALLAGSHFVMLDERVATSRSIARIVAGLETPDSGSCTVGTAQTEASLPESRRRIGYVPNPPVVVRGMKLAKYLLLSASAYRRPGDASEDVRSTIDQVVQWCDRC